MPRKTQKQWKEELKQARIVLKGLNRVRRGAEAIVKDPGASVKERSEAIKGLVKATREWGKQCLRVEYLEYRDREGLK